MNARVDLLSSRPPATAHGGRLAAARGARTAAILALASAAVLSCGEERRSTEPPPDPFVVRRIPEEIREEMDRLVAGNTDFALRLYARLRERDGNLFLSPYSISTALALTWAGAREKTESEMAQTLAFPFPQERLHVVFGTLQDNLQVGGGIGGYRLAIANRLWGAPGRTWLPEFLGVLSDRYHAPLEELDFAGHPEESRQTINGWVRERTEGKIPELLPPGSIGPATSIALTNAIYFKGIWKHQFDPRDTAARRFWVTESDSISVQMMFRKADYGVTVTDEYQVLAMPFRGMDLSLIVLLPMRWSLQRLEEELTPANLEAWLANLREQEVYVAFPKFTFSNKWELRDDLVALGMPTAFDVAAADFSGMDGTRQFSLERLYHEAFIKVDEVGAEAAAATGGVPPPSSPIFFTVDHPFLFLIYDHVTDSVLFLGRVNRPIP